MANIITADQIQQGDKIKVTLAESGDGDRKYTVIYEGVAHETDGINRNGPIWRTPESWNLYAHEDGAIVELLDRPKPKIKVPVGTYAQVTYTRENYASKERFAVLTPYGKWKCYDAAGEWQDTKNPEAMDRLLNSELVHNVKVLFEGVAK